MHVVEEPEAVSVMRRLVNNGRDAKLFCTTSDHEVILLGAVWYLEKYIDMLATECYYAREREANANDRADIVEQDALRYLTAKSPLFGIADWGSPYAKPIIRIGDAADEALDSYLAAGEPVVLGDTGNAIFSAEHETQD